MGFELTSDFLGTLEQKLYDLGKIDLKPVATYAESHISGVSSTEKKPILYFCLVWLGFSMSDIHNLKKPLVGGSNKNNYFESDWLAGGNKIFGLSLGNGLLDVNKVKSIVFDQGFPIEDLIRAGYGYDLLKQALTAHAVADALDNMDPSTLDEIGCNLKHNGFPASHLGNVDVCKLNTVFGYSPQELKDAGYDAETLAWLGINAVSKLGYSTAEMESAFGKSWYYQESDDSLREAGFNVLALKYKEYYAKFYSQNGKDCVCGGMDNSSMYGVMPMPQKFDPSDGGSSFSRGRAAWLQNVPSNSLYNRVELNKAYKVAPSSSRGGKPLPGTDASTVVHMRRIEALGKGTARNGVYKKDAPLSFCATNRSNANTVRQARRRARSSGNVVPPKVTAPREGNCAAGRIVA